VARHALARVAEAAAGQPARKPIRRMRRAAGGAAGCGLCPCDAEISPFLQAALDYARFRRAAIILLTCAGPEASADPLADVVIDLAQGPR